MGGTPNLESRVKAEGQAEAEQEKPRVEAEGHTKPSEAEGQVSNQNPS